MQKIKQLKGDISGFAKSRKYQTIVFCAGLRGPLPAGPLPRRLRPRSGCGTGRGTPRWPLVMRVGRGSVGSRGRLRMRPEGGRVRGTLPGLGDRPAGAPVPAAWPQASESPLRASVSLHVARKGADHFGAGAAPSPTRSRRVLRGGGGGTCQPGRGPCFASVLSSWVTPKKDMRSPGASVSSSAKRTE